MILTDILNIPEFTVSELANSIQKTLHSEYSHVRVRGEISGLNTPPSGHYYFSLKDENSKINSIIWRTTSHNLQVTIEDGIEVVATGRISTYAPRSNYQLIIDNLEIAGEGALLKLVEERKKKLEKEGLFHSDLKKKIPLIPNVLGIVTSLKGAALQDILRIIRDRYPIRIVIWPVLVQGDKADMQISSAIDGFNKLLKKENKPDVIIVGRGGGSIEDLMAFNSEKVVYSIAKSNIPIISAVGHENDNCLSDLVADVRAPTPTAAAEIVVPIRSELIESINSLRQRLFHSIIVNIERKKNLLNAYTKALGKPSQVYEILSQRIDHLDYKLINFLKSMINRHKTTINNKKISEPSLLLGVYSSNLNNIYKSLLVVWTNYFSNSTREIATLAKLLDAKSYENLLSRGFSLIKNEEGNLIKTINSVKIGDKINIQISDGSLDAKIKKIKYKYGKK